MTITTFDKVVENVSHLQSHLRANGIPSAVVVVQSGATPNLYVHHNVAENPTALVNAYVNPDYLVAVSNKTIVNGAPEASADGVDVHSVTITKYDGTTKTPKGTGTETIKIMSNNPITSSPPTVVLANGAAVVNLGPVSMIGEWNLIIADQAGALVQTTIRLRFV